MCVIDGMIPVRDPDWRLKKCVERLLSQTLELRKLTLVLSVDDSWDEKQVEDWFRGEDRVEFLKIPQKTYNHGGTRHWWAEKSDAEYLLFLVQDAVPEDETLVERMIKSLEDDRIAVVYARQVPGFGCDAIEEYTRYFNYPAMSLRKTRNKLLTGDVKDCFTSNVCAAYRRDWYERAGGFERHILLSEDTVYAAKVLMMGADVIYNAEARVVHAHNFGYLTQWKRNFDIGAVHGKYREIFEKLSSEKEGIRLVMETAGYLIRKRKLLLFPKLFLLSAVKYTAYQAGKHYDKLPAKLVRRWSWDQNYWRDKDE